MQIFLPPLPEGERVAEQTSVREAGRGSVSFGSTALSPPAFAKASAGTLSRKREREKKERARGSTLTSLRVALLGLADVMLG